jgi:peptidoglycan/LPS O-acetylase OafA/YrhL
VDLADLLDDSAVAGVGDGVGGDPNGAAGGPLRGDYLELTTCPDVISASLEPMKPAIYRADIDGLRAISVLAVIGFHLGLCPGGFVGVDIFFVISGYLIGGIVLRELALGQFSLQHFYERRVRRILPALLATLLLSTVAAVALLLPSEIVDFAHSAIASLVFSANIFFYETRGYFAPTASEVPLLHLWSLGVEEQFYLVFPVLAFATAKVRPKAIMLVIIGLGLLSLLWTEWTVHRNPQGAFYLPQYRAFELAIGIALTGVPRLGGKLQVTIAAIGGLLILGSFIALNDTMPFPGWAALIPCGGAAFLICARANLLSWRPLPAIGRISYPMYLVHWPLIVFGRILIPSGHEVVFDVDVVIGTIVLSLLILLFVEKPIRFGSPKILWGSVATGFLAAIAIPAAILLMEKPETSVNLDEVYLRGSCFLDNVGPDHFESRCIPQHHPWALLLGDSHAADLYHGLREELDREGYALGMLSAAGCPPMLEYNIPELPFCKKIGDYTLKVVSERKPDILILSAYWKPLRIGDLENTLRGLSKIHGPKIVVIGNTPIFAQSVPGYLARRGSEPIGMVDGSQVDKALDKMTASFPAVRYLPLKAIVCPDGVCLLQGDDRASYYLDEAHLSAAGSDWIASRITPSIVGK